MLYVRSLRMALKTMWRTVWFHRWDWHLLRPFTRIRCIMLVLDTRCGIEMIMSLRVMIELLIRRYRSLLPLDVMTSDWRLSRCDLCWSHFWRRRWRVCPSLKILKPSLDFLACWSIQHSDFLKMEGPFCSGLERAYDNFAARSGSESYAVLLDLISLSSPRLDWHCYCKHYYHYDWRTVWPSTFHWSFAGGAYNDPYRTTLERQWRSS